MEHTTTAHSGSPGRPRMVVLPAQQIQRTTTPKGGSSLTDQVRRRDGRRRRRLGSHLQYLHNGRPLVLRRADMAHQCSRATNSLICSTDICKESHGHGSPTARQPGRCAIYQSDGQGAQLPPQPAGTRSVAMVPRSKYHTVHGIHSRRKERRSRLPVQASRISRMATTARRFRPNPAPFPPQRDRSLRIQGQYPVTPVHLVATRTILKRYRRVHSRLATGARLRVSTVCSHRQSSPTSSAAKSQFVGSGNTSMERSAMVSEPVSRVDCPSSSSPESPGSPAGPVGNA